VLAAVGWRPTSLNRIVERSGLSVAAVVHALDDLGAAGQLVEEGAWYRRLPGSDGG
jgi:predicted Rossmann fold nucleotide-binding protein DprA/Smf involved in DNA uptake